MAITILIATIIDSVRSFICLLWLNVATAMRMIVIGSVVITTNVLTKAIILPSIFNILVSLFLDAKLAIILITCCAATAFYLHFSPILAKLERFPRNSSKFPRKFLARSDFYLYLCHRYNNSAEHSALCGDARDRIRRFAFHVFFCPLWWIT